MEPWAVGKTLGQNAIRQSGLGESIKTYVLGRSPVWGACAMPRLNQTTRSSCSRDSPSKYLSKSTIAQASVSKRRGDGLRLTDGVTSIVVVVGMSSMQLGILLLRDI